MRRLKWHLTYPYHYEEITVNFEQRLPLATTYVLDTEQKEGYTIVTGKSYCEKSKPL